MYLESVSQWDMQRHLNNFRTSFSVGVQFWCLGTVTHADAQGQKAPFPLRKRAGQTLMPSKG